MHETNLIRNIHSGKFIELEKAMVGLRPDGIVHVCYKKGATVDPELMMEMNKVYKEICQGIKRPFLYTAMDYVTITREARAKSLELEPVYPGNAAGVVADSLAYRLIGNFYLKINRPKIPLEIFSNEDAAVEWLKKFLPETA